MPEPFEGLSIREKRDLFFLHDRATSNGYNLWDPVHTHEKFLSSERPPAVEISEAVALCLQDKEAEEDSQKDATIAQIGSSEVCQLLQR